MSAFDTPSSAVTRPVRRPLTRADAPGPVARLAARALDAWPLAVIAVGALLSLAWTGLLAWGVLRLVLHLA